MDSPFECIVCFNVYSEQYLPTTLPCGHSLCISHLKQLKRKECPLCTQHFSCSRKDMKTTYALLEASIQATANELKKDSIKKVTKEKVSSSKKKPSSWEHHDARRKKNPKLARSQQEEGRNKSEQKASKTLSQEEFQQLYNQMVEVSKQTLRILKQLDSAEARNYMLATRSQQEARSNKKRARRYSSSSRSRSSSSNS